MTSRSAGAGRGLVQAGAGGGLRVLAWLLPGAAVTVALLANLPLIYLFVRSLAEGWTAYWQLVWNEQTVWLVLRTLSLAAGVVVLAMAIALPYAWLVARTDLPRARFWALMGALPLVVPSYVAAFTWVAMLGPRGFLQGWLEPLGVARLPALATGFSGALVVLGLFSYPYIYLLLVATLRDLDPELEESARALGSGPLESFFRVVLPQLRPALSGGGLLVVLYTLSDFGAVSIVRVNTFTLAVFNAYSGLFDRSVAASLATVLVLLTLAWIALEWALARGSRAARTRATRRAPRVSLGSWRWPAQGLLCLLSVLTLVIPLGVSSSWALRGLMVGNPLGQLGWALFNSVLASSAAAVVAVVVSLPVAIWAVRHRTPAALITERLSHSGFALPGLVIALSFVFFATRYAPWAYQTLGLLVVAYVVRFLPQSLAATRTALQQLSPRFEEAARSLGQSPPQVFFHLTLPLLRPGLLAGGGLVFLTAMKELPATLILRPTGFDTLATRVWSAASEGIYSQAALPSLLLVALSVVPVYTLVIRPALAPRAATRDEVVR